VKSSSNGSRPRRAAKKASSRRFAERELAGAEAARVGVRHVVVVEPQPHARIRRRSDRVEQQRAGHAQVLEEIRLAGELPHEVLAAPVEALDDAAFERVGELAAGERARPALVEDLEPPEGAPLHMRCEMAADGFDFGELWHV
jgi:hypothetical protein